MPQTQLTFDCATQEDAPLPSFVDMWKKVVLAALIWGIGTAIGAASSTPFWSRRLRFIRHVATVTRAVCCAVLYLVTMVLGC